MIAAAAPFVFNVVERLSQIDKTSWPWLSQNGTPEQVLAFLGQANLHRLDLNEIAWRMKDRDEFKQITSLLESRHVYHDTLWSYGILHNDPATIRAFLRHSPFADRCGLYLVSPLLVLEPVERLDYQHLEYAPLVNPRAHQVGAKRKILNNRFREQYQRFLKVLSYKPALTDVDELAVAYYLTLQDRVEEALDWYARVEPSGGAGTAPVRLPRSVPRLLPRRPRPRAQTGQGARRHGGGPLAHPFRPGAEPDRRDRRRRGRGGSTGKPRPGPGCAGGERAGARPCRSRRAASGSITATSRAAR